MPAKILSQDFKLVLDKQALKDIFTRVEKPSDRHRIAERISKINQLARPLGVSLSLERELCRITIYAPSQEKFRELALLLRKQGGPVQRIFAEWLEAHFTMAADQRSPFSGLRDSQLNYLRGRLSRDWGIFAGFNPDKVLVDVSCGERSKAGLLEHAARLLQASSHRGLFVLGDVGAGKTTLLYQALKDFDRFSDGPNPLIPVYIPSTRLFFKWGDGTIPWESIPGVEPRMTASLESTFKDGKLLLLIDGVNENPNCVDFTNPGVQYFWECVFRNTFVVSTHPRHFESCLKLSPLEIFGKLPRLALPQWRLEDYQAQFANLIKAAGGSPDPFLAGRLKKFPVEKWVEKAMLLRKTPLVGCAAANFVANSPETRLPRNEYELMEHMVLCHLNHKAFHGNIGQRDAILRVLMNISVQAYREGQKGERWCLSMPKALEIARAHCGGLGENADLRAILGNFPFLDFTPDNDLLFLDHHVGDFLVARFILNALAMKDYAGFKELLFVGIRYDRVGKFYFQGFECPSKEVRLQMLRGSEELYRHFLEKYRKTPEFSISLVLGQILQPLGHLGIPEAYDFLWDVFCKTEGGNFMFLSATIALTRGGQSEAEELFIRWLKKHPSNRNFILQWRLFYETRDRTRRDFEDFRPTLVPNWDDACDWLLRVLREDNKHFYPLRHLYVYTLSEFIKTKGPAPFLPPSYGNGTGLSRAMDRRRFLKQILSTLERDPALGQKKLFKEDVQDLRAQASKFLEPSNGETHEQARKAVPTAKSLAKQAGGKEAAPA